MKLRWLCLLLGFTLTMSVGTAGDKGGDKEKIQGTWVVESGQDNGKDFPAESKGMRIVFKGDTMSVKFKDIDMKATFKLDPTKKPKEIDADFGEKMKGTGIYELTGDTLKIAHGDFGDPRPKDFVSKEGSKITVIVLKREKVEKK